MSFFQKTGSSGTRLPFSYTDCTCVFLSESGPSGEEGCLCEISTASASNHLTSRITTSSILEGRPLSTRGPSSRAVPLSVRFDVQLGRCSRDRNSLVLNGISWNLLKRSKTSDVLGTMVRQICSSHVTSSFSPLSIFACATNAYDVG